MRFVNEQQPSLVGVAVAPLYDDHKGYRERSNVERKRITHRLHLLSEDVADRQPLLLDAYHTIIRQYLQVFFAPLNVTAKILRP